MYLKIKSPTKLPDTAAYRLGNGELVQPWELLFLIPKRPLSEERNDGICDVARYYSIGVMGPDTVYLPLSDSHGDSIFRRYGQTEEDRTLTLKPHSLRHLQNSELFKMGIADSIISKRFNRKSITQSYEYDHRSLAEQLDQIEIPEDVELALGAKSTTVYKMIASGKASGPIVDSFRHIQKTQGDDAAFDFLKVEADGFHATPYGHCLNSFTVDPCPKNLECFSGCRHLSATDYDLYMQTFSYETVEAAYLAAPSEWDLLLEGAADTSKDFMSRLHAAEGLYLALCEVLLRHKPDKGLSLWRSLFGRFRTRFNGHANIPELVHIAFRVRRAHRSFKCVRH